jgi:hypothetical protein
VVVDSGSIPIPPGQAGTGGSISCPPGTVPWGGAASFDGGIPSVREDINSTAPTDVGWTQAFAIATCPSGTVVLSGGALSSSVSINVELLSAWPQSMHKFKTVRTAVIGGGIHVSAARPEVSIGATYAICAA